MNRSECECFFCFAWCVCSISSIPSAGNVFSFTFIRLIPLRTLYGISIWNNYSTFQLSVQIRHTRARAKQKRRSHLIFTRESIKYANLMNFIERKNDYKSKKTTKRKKKKKNGAHQINGRKTKTATQTGWLFFWLVQYMRWLPLFFRFCVKPTLMWHFVCFELSLPDSFTLQLSENATRRSHVRCHFHIFFLAYS